MREWPLGMLLLLLLLAGLPPATSFLRAPVRGGVRSGLYAAAMCHSGRVDRDSVEPPRERHAGTEMPALPLRGFVAHFGVDGGNGGTVCVRPSAKGGLGLFVTRDVAAGEALAYVPRRAGDACLCMRECVPAQ